MSKMPLFVELPSFEQYREDYLNDDKFRELQKILTDNPKAGPRMKGTGGLRKVRYSDPKRNKGKRGGVRVIYYYLKTKNEFLLFTLYGKIEATDLTEKEKTIFKKALKEELKARKYE